MRRVAKDQRLVPHHNRRTGTGSLQVEFGPGAEAHGPGHMRNSLPVSGVCCAESGKGEVAGEVVGESEWWEERGAHAIVYDDKAELMGVL